MRTVVDLLRRRAPLRVDALPVRRFPFDQAVEAYGWLDEQPRTRRSRWRSRTTAQLQEEEQ